MATHELDGVKIRIYKPAKTVADCFKFRNKIGLDVALEALRDCWWERQCKVCRMANVMQPYLESVV